MPVLIITTARAAYRWHGGPYVDVHEAHDWSGKITAHNVINVWDYETDTPRIPRTREALAAAVHDHENGEDAARTDAMLRHPSNYRRR